MISLKKVLQSSDGDVIQSIPSVLDVAEAVVEIEARQDVLLQLCSQSIADHDIEGSQYGFAKSKYDFSFKN